jgi:hypothetical protein
MQTRSLHGNSTMYSDLEALATYQYRLTSIKSFGFSPRSSRDTWLDLKQIIAISKSVVLTWSSPCFTSKQEKLYLANPCPYSFWDSPLAIHLAEARSCFLHKTHNGSNVQTELKSTILLHLKHSAPWAPVTLGFISPWPPWYGSNFDWIWFEHRLSLFLLAPGSGPP